MGNKGAVLFLFSGGKFPLDLFSLSWFLFLSLAFLFSDSMILSSSTMCRGGGSWKRISLSAVKWLRLTGLRKAAGDRC